MLSIDLNCDMGEGMPNDAAIMPYISSVNIACGYHAGDSSIMQRTIDLALRHNVAIGAHPGFADKINFGRTEQKLSQEDYYELVKQQLLIIQQHIKAAGASMHHVKPHGALYNMSAMNNTLATIVAKAVKDHDPSLILYGLSNSYSVTAAATIGLQTASEVFADRTYTHEGNLTPRTNTNALITHKAQSVKQVLQMIQQQTVTTIDGKIIPVKAETICIHGDGTHTVSFVKLIAEQLKKNNIQVKTI
ncbi:LamB/YcsF family protein [Panacibacter ginsenosidivorans]|uniref:LamB/YcsF family protein n=1 Tax=Panacibacter ginsenosidivorans TaxID=1813871 RepID=A0A5B8VBQ8_9BACT|nr:5-oxoprolinase subunit PxpA [Panacibacter ginsenosidivorans]QEC68864.1 LamB/YcsF family protein [Panacibacter ginsenosidivorans]